MIMKRILSVMLLALALPVPALWAQGADALPFTRIERDPANAALAGAGTAYAGNAAYKAFSDAALLSFYEGTLDAAVSYQRWAPASALNNNVQAGFAYKVVPALTLSAGYSLMIGQPYQGTGAYGQPTGTLQPLSHVIALGLGWRVAPTWSVGVNLRYAIEKADGLRSGFSGDISAAWQPLASLRVMAGVSTLGTVLASEDGSKYSQPASGRLGVDWAIGLASNHTLDVMANADVFFTGAWGVALGVQYDWKKMVFVRCGYRLASNRCVIPSHLGVGAGVHLGRFRLDVSYLTASPALGNTLSAGLGYSF